MFFQNRGMHLESLINYTIEIYNKQKKALIFKTSPKIIIKNNNYYFINKSTVDYHGVYQGKYICFEAKTTNKKVLPWNNITNLQWSFLKQSYEHKGISFIIIYFNFYQKYYLVFFQQLVFLKEKNLTINYQWINKNGYQIKIIYPFLLNFIEFL